MRSVGQAAAAAAAARDWAAAVKAAEADATVMVVVVMREAEEATRQESVQMCQGGLGCPEARMSFRAGRRMSRKHQAMGM